MKTLADIDIRRATERAHPIGVVGILVTLIVVTALAGCGRKDKPPSSWGRAGYHVRESTVYFLADWTSKAFAIEGADPATFEYSLQGQDDNQFARDKAKVYFRGQPVEGAEPKTFQVISPSYWRDATNVYRNNHVICDDADHFVEISLNFVKNGHAVYALSDRLQIISEDPANFRQIHVDQFYSYCGDTRKRYINGNEIEEADVATFKVLKGAYSRDATQGYYFDKPLPEGAEIDHLEILEGAYAKDRRQVYHLGKLLPGADAATFEVMDDKFQKARDAHRRYEYGQAMATPLSEGNL